MDKILQPLFELQPLTLYLLIGFFCYTEAALFLGFVTPGELAVVTGGILASRGQVDFAILAMVILSATVAGNATGFYLGKRYGEDVLQWRPIHKFLSRPIEQAKRFMRRHGEWAIVLGRVSTPSRVITPFLAGASGLAYRRFVIFDVTASLLWALCFLTLGYVLGESWEVIKDISGTAAILVLILFLAALLIRWAAVRVAANRKRVHAAFIVLLRATGTRGLARTVKPGFMWLSRRLDPRVAQGLGLTICFFALLLAGAGVGLVFSQTEALWGLARIDFPVLDWMNGVRTEEAVMISRNGLELFHWPGILALLLPIVMLVAWRATWLAALRFGIGVIGAATGAFALDRFVLEGHVPNAEYPSISVATTAALVVHATALTARSRGWSSAVGCAGFGLFALCAVGLATIVAGWAAPSGIALGFAMGLGWAALLELPWAARRGSVERLESTEQDRLSGPSAPAAQD